jgi:hypothetical protein
MPKDGSKDEATVKALAPLYVQRTRCAPRATNAVEYLTAYQHYVSNCLCYLGILVSHITLSGSFLTS